MKIEAFLRRTLALLLIFLTGCSTSQTSDNSLKAEPGVAVVKTESGLLQGYIHQGIYTYKGVPYAQAERFMAPKKVSPWAGVRTALTYGDICPQGKGLSLANDGSLFFPNTRGPQSEGCQVLNIWTPSLDKEKKRPVMVWLHGGGFSNGSSIEAVSYDGENLSQSGDVVVVSVNHRLNVLGFLDLSDYGSEYNSSANAGMMDIVASLRWVKENIAQFGGDPENITVFGQSGGGAKVLTLMAAPSADGLFQKAIVQSGAVDHMGMTNPDTSVSRRVAELTLENLDIDAKDIERIKTVPYNELNRAANKALTQTAKEQHLTGPFANEALFWAPVLDGNFLPVNPVEDVFASQAKNIPLLIGSNLSEWTTVGLFGKLNELQSDNINTWSDEKIKEQMQLRYGANAQAVAKAFNEAYPEKSAGEALYVDTMLRTPALKSARLKADQDGAAVYNYVFAWNTPVLGGFALSYHCAEIPFVFNNIDLAKLSTGAGKEVYMLADKISRAWVNFARTGNPNAEGLPDWPAFTRENGAAMIFDTTSQVKYNHDLKLMKILAPTYNF